MTRLVFSTLVSLVLLAATSYAQVEGVDLSAKVRVLLSGYERVPAEEEWQVFGDKAALALELIELVSDESESLSLRARALVSLRHAPVEASREFVRQVALDGARQAILRRKAARAVGALGGSAALQTLSTLLSDKSPKLREATLRAIADVSDPKAPSVLKAHLEIEPKAHVRATCTQLLQRITVKP